MSDDPRRIGGRAVLHVEIQPCLLGFAVSTWITIEDFPGRGFKREAGIYESFGELCKELMFTQEPFVVHLK